MEHPVCVYIRARLSAQRRDSFAFLILCARARTRFYHTLAIFFRPPVRRLVLTPRDSLVTAASRYRPLGQEPTRCPALRTQTSEGEPFIMRYASDTSPSRRPGKIAFEETLRDFRFMG